MQDPPIATFLFSNTAMSWFWLIVRVWVVDYWNGLAYPMAASSCC